MTKRYKFIIIVMRNEIISTFVLPPIDLVQ